jgi:small-conductance mechanosensitive channel
VVALGLFVALLILASDGYVPKLVDVLTPGIKHPNATHNYFGYLAKAGLVLLAAAFGTYAIRSGTEAVFRHFDPQARVLWRNLTSWTLYVVMALIIATAVGFNPSGLVVGGAVVGIIIGAAAQSSLGNLFAGLVLMLVRPYRIGASIRLRSSIVGGAEYEGMVVDQNTLYTTLRTATGEVLRLPNAAVMTSALIIGRPPLQAAIDLDLAPNTPLGPLREALDKELGLHPSVVTVTPVKLDLCAPARFSCRVEVRAMQAVEPHVFADAVTKALQQTQPVLN